ncbi:MAG: ACP S-malonyltransferase [Gammaproteobacteria bacterium]|nr:ACP S-malonyltransferase [Gammaproteobacteria bacterium]
MNSTLAFVFPGQGSQSVGMLTQMSEQSPVVSQMYEKASEVLGYDLWDLITNGPIEELNKTHITQPAMLVAGVAMWRIWKEAGGDIPCIMAGHSLGEYTALVCAEALGFEDAIRLVEVRGRYMQDAVPEGAGAMAAILGLDDASVIQVCEDAAQGEIIAAVNFNSPGQVVIAGNVGAVERATNIAKEAGAKRAVILPVSVPSHCSLMMPVAEKLKEKFRDIAISEPIISVISNVDVTINSNGDEICDALIKQLYSPVRWVETIQKMAADGIENIVECGPGKVLMGLNKRIDRKIKHHSIFDAASLEKTQAVIKS